MYFKISTSKQRLSLSLIWMLTLLSSLSARETTGFVLSLNLAESLITETEWLLSNSPAINKTVPAIEPEIPLTNAATLVSSPKLDFDPILLLFKRTPDTIGLVAKKKLVGQTGRFHRPGGAAAFKRNCIQ